MDKRDRVDSWSAVVLALGMWVALLAFTLTGAKCAGGKVACERNSDGQIRCELEMPHRH